MSIKKTEFASGIIVAAGSGTRMGGVKKPLIKLGTKTLFERVLDAFLRSFVSDITVVCPEDDSAFRNIAEKTVKNCGAEKEITFTRGGDTRTDSVFLGIKASSENSKFACVHDCARPFVTPEIIDRVIESSFETGSATACCRVTDTIRYVDEEHKVIYTPNRKNLLAIMTPQCFDKQKFVAAYAFAKAQNKNFTDDCGLLEDAGIKTKYVDCPKDNMKLTTAYDVTLARAIRLIREKSKKEQ